VNDEKGSYKDILTLRDLAKKKVQEMFGIELQEEARIIENE
jgi:UDP-N-acetylenolpyruvoylglucosamine reductase